jgi:hypothetical protein
MICNPHQLLFGDLIKKNKMGGECNVYEGEEICMEGFGG